MHLTTSEFQALRNAAFSPNNPDYRWNIIEAPIGDGTWDTEKRYAHLASRYGLQGMALLYPRVLLHAATLASAVLISPAH